MAMAFVYILESQSSGRYYVGSTDNLARRLCEQRQNHAPFAHDPGPGP